MKHNDSRAVRRRQAILRELYRRELESLPAPTWAELNGAIGAKSARYHAAYLRREGYVDRDPALFRTIRLTEKGRDLVRQLLSESD